MNNIFTLAIEDGQSISFTTDRSFEEFQACCENLFNQDLFWQQVIKGLEKDGFKILETPTVLYRRKEEETYPDNLLEELRQRVATSEERNQKDEERADAERKRYQDFLRLDYEACYTQRTEQWYQMCLRECRNEADLGRGSHWFNWRNIFSEYVEMDKKSLLEIAERLRKEGLKVKLNKPIPSILEFDYSLSITWIKKEKQV